MIDTAKMIDSAKRRALAMRIAILPSISGPFPQKKAHYGQSIAQFAPGDKLAAASRASLRQYRKYQIFGLGLLPTSHTKRKPPMSALCQKQTFCAAAETGAIRSPRRRGEPPRWRFSIVLRAAARRRTDRTST